MKIKITWKCTDGSEVDLIDGVVAATGDDCPDCKGTGEYQGLGLREPCKTCKTCRESI